MAKPWKCFHYPFPVNGSYTGTIKVSLNHTLQISLYYSTHKVFKSHVNLHQLTSCTLQSNSVSCVVAPNVFKITPRHGPRTKHTCHVFAILPAHCALAGPQKTHHVTATQPAHWRADRCLATSYNIRPLRHSFHCCALEHVYRAVA
jgi:hypothetical protein